MSQADQNAYQQAINGATSTPVNVPTGGVGIQVQTQSTSVPTYVPDQSSIMRRASYCETKTIDANVFNDPQFVADCGVCISGGRTNDGTSFKGTKGLFIEPSSRTDFLLKKRQPMRSISSSAELLDIAKELQQALATSIHMRLAKDELGAFLNRKGCQDSKQLDGNCATCLQVSKFHLCWKRSPAAG
jgi:hypothetical protein